VRIWKVLGIAGLVGVAATGVVVARSERKRRSYTPDEVRERLRARASGLDAMDAQDNDGETRPDSG
jgi:hypothetical protein